MLSLYLDYCRGFDCVNDVHAAVTDSKVPVGRCTGQDWHWTEGTSETESQQHPCRW